jgi:hypothetical protein
MRLLSESLRSIYLSNIDSAELALLFDIFIIVLHHLLIQVKFDKENSSNLVLLNLEILNFEDV